MKTPNLPASLWLPVAGAGAVLLIGAFARFDPASSSHPTADVGPASMQYSDATPPAQAAGAPNWPDDLSPGMSEIVKLVQAHVDENVILAYVKNSGQTYSPTADEILYLADLGLSQNVITALFNGKAPVAPQVSEQTAAATTPPPPPVAPLSVAPLSAEESPPVQQAPPASAASVFYNDLAPYGGWVQQPDYGLCWQPAVETDNPDWRPYLDAGQWLYSDSGWYWNSQYSWGWAVFHYGRWVKVPPNGWVWVPGNDWAPAWVAWRATPSYIGWAPLPPGVSLNALAQLTYNTRPVGPNSSSGLAASAYTFVGASNFLSGNLPRHALPAPRIGALVQTAPVINGGASRDAVAAATHRAVAEIALRTVSSPEAAGASMDRKTLAVYRPVIIDASSAPSTEASRRGTPTMLAEIDAGEAALVPAAPAVGVPRVQLPPLRYPATPAPHAAGYRDQTGVAAFARESRAFNQERPRAFGMPVVERPGSPAPRFEESVRVAHEVASRVEAPSRPAAEEPARAAPAPASSSSSSTSASRSGK